MREDMVSFWLTCPECGVDGEDVSLSVTTEHVVLQCGHCDSSVKAHHNDHERTFGGRQ